MKRKTLTLAICFLALIAIVSVGFASWIITRPVVDQNQEGSITAETVNDVSYQFNVKANDGSSNVIHFGSPDGSPQKGGQTWLSNNGEKPENLSYSMVLSVNYYELMTTDNVYVNFEIKEGAEGTFADITTADTKFKAAKEAGYVAPLYIQVNEDEADEYVAKNHEVAKTSFGVTVTYKTTSDGAETTEFVTVAELKTLIDNNKSNNQFTIAITNNGTDDNSTTTIVRGDDNSFSALKGDAYCVVNVQFNWGSHFAATAAHTHYEAGTPLNPLVYYSYLDVNTSANDAMTALDNINAIALAETYYKITFSANQK